MFIYNGIVYANKPASDYIDVETMVKEKNKDNVYKKDEDTVDNLEEQEGESVVNDVSFDIGNAILNSTGIADINIPFYDGIKNSAVFSEAMLNTQQVTGDHQFALLSRQNGILDDDSIYVGGAAIFLPVWNNTSFGDFNTIGNFGFDYYMVSILGDWTVIPPLLVALKNTFISR